MYGTLRNRFGTKEIRFNGGRIQIFAISGEKKSLLKEFQPELPGWYEEEHLKYMNALYAIENALEELPTV